MSIRHAILGFLSWQPSTGYELKKRFAEATPFHWSGNNNQVYGALIELHREGLVQVEVVQQEKRPARKVYAITERGREALEGWLREGSEPPETRADFHARLAWSASLPEDEFERLAAAYEERLEGEILYRRERERRGEDRPARDARERLIWASLALNRIDALEAELDWIRRLRGELKAL